LAERIVIDCDPGHDDAIALLLALASPEVELVGVTTVAGNQTLEKTTANAIRVLDFAGRDDIQVAAGADRPLVRERHVAAHVHGETGLDGPELPPPQREPLEEHAVELLARTVHGATLVPIGPLTNVALLLAQYPEVRPARIVLMGGSIGLGNITPAAEFNIWEDPEAAARVFESGIEITMVGLDVTHQALLMTADAEQLRASGRTGRMVAELYDFFHRYHARTYAFDGSPIHDALALAHVFRPELLRTEHRNVLVDTGPELSRGRTYVDLWRRTERGPNAHVAVEVDGRAFIEVLLERLPTLDRG
jgi:inosine-uridine nucleoside N-ribohydrolase